MHAPNAPRKPSGEEYALAEIGGLIVGYTANLG